MDNLWIGISTQNYPNHGILWLIKKRSDWELNPGLLLDRQASSPLDYQSIHTQSGFNLDRPGQPTCCFIQPIGMMGVYKDYLIANR